MKPFLPLIALLCGVSDPTCAAENLVGKPNLIFILSDDPAEGDLGGHGQKLIQTQNLDQLAAHGVKFPQACAANPLGSPTRRSVRTGLGPARTGITGPVAPLPQVMLDKPLAEKKTAPARACREERDALEDPLR